MFNLIIEPITATDIILKPLDDWYVDGTEIDITKYVDIEQINVKRPPLHKEIEFKFQETDCILGAKYRELNNIGYGDLKATFDFDGAKKEIEVPFDNMMFERLTSETDGTLSEFYVGKAIDEDYDTVVPNPILIFNRGLYTASDGLAFINGSGTRIDVKTTINVGNVEDLADGQTINFGSEISGWDFAEKENSLFQTYWSNYISDLYDLGRRIYEYDAIIPLQKLISINLNDRLIINGTRYIINNIQSNLTNGKTKLELINTDRNFTA
jgi:hypothetical protein